MLIAALIGQIKRYIAPAETENYRIANNAPLNNKLITQTSSTAGQHRFVSNPHRRHQTNGQWLRHQIDFTIVRSPFDVDMPFQPVTVLTSERSAGVRSYHRNMVHHKTDSGFRCEDK